MAPSKTKPGTRKLSDLTRKLVVPEGIVATGWPAVADTCRRKLGITFDDWQDQSGRVILSKRADGKLAAMVGGVGISICRQAGKTHLLSGMVFGLCVNRPNTLVIWSSHHSKTHGETFLAMQDFAARQMIAPYIKQVFTGSGDEEIRFHNGSRILFGARERGFGRGIPGVDVIIADEAQIMSERAVDAQIATVNTSDFGLVVYVGTPPRPEDASEAFTQMRAQAWDGSLRNSVWIEIGAEPDADPDSPETWRVNPSYPRRTPAESILRLKAKLSPESFLREGLGVWPDMAPGDAITPQMVKASTDPSSSPTDPVSVGVYVNLPRTNSAIAIAGYRADGRIHVETVPAVRDKPEFETLNGTSWIAPRTKELIDSWSPSAVVIDERSSAASLIPEFIDLGVELTYTNAPKLAQACGQVYDALVEQRLFHTGQPGLMRAMLAAKWRTLADSRAWDRKDKNADITQLMAVTLAVWGLLNNTNTAESAYNSDAVDFMML